MAIVQYLSSLDLHRLPKLLHLQLDDLESKSRNGLHIELPQSDGTNCTLSPTLHPVHADCEKRIENLIQQGSDILLYLKERILETLVMDTVIIETSSYFLNQNDGLLIARLKYFNEVEKILEIKLYTAPPRDFLKHYSDKIYIGRCFINLEKREFPYQGLNFYILSLMDQYEILRDKAKGRLDDTGKYEETFFVEIHELISEVVSEVIRVLDGIPPHFAPAQWSREQSIQVKACYRDIVHMLLELAEEVVEFENVLMFNDEDKYARYVTKYKKDLKNIINFLNINLLSRLSWRIRQVP